MHHQVLSKKSVTKISLTGYREFGQAKEKVQNTNEQIKLTTLNFRELSKIISKRSIEQGPAIARQASIVAKTHVSGI